MWTRKRKIRIIFVAVRETQTSVNQRGGFVSLLVIVALMVLAVIAGWYWWSFYISRGVADPIANGVLFEPSPPCNGVCHFRRRAVRVVFLARVTRAQAEEAVNRRGYRIAEDHWNMHSLVVAVPVFGEPRAIREFRTEEDTVQSADYYYLEATPPSDVSF